MTGRRRLEDVSHFFLDGGGSIPAEPITRLPIRTRPRLLQVVSASSRVVGAMVVAGMAAALARGGKRVLVGEGPPTAFGAAFGLGLVLPGDRSAQPILETPAGVWVSTVDLGRPISCLDPQIRRAVEERVAESDVVFIHFGLSDLESVQPNVASPDELIFIVDEPTADGLLEVYRAIKGVVAGNEAVSVRLIVHGNPSSSGVSWARLVEGVERFLHRDCTILGTLREESRLATTFLSGAFFDEGWDEIVRVLAPLASRWSRPVTETERRNPVLRLPGR
ncbi:MAG: hypothetical protein ABIO65_06435 [Nitrospiria bacterium]